MTIKTQLKAGGINTTNHNEALHVRTTLKAGGSLRSITTKSSRFAPR